MAQKSPHVSHARVGDDYGEHDAHELQATYKTDELDRRDMLRMNKPQEMRRNFRFVTMFGFSVVLMASWEIVLATAVLGLLDGGTAGFLYTNLASWIGFTCVYASLGEQGSMAPTSGGQYHWVSEFSPRWCQKFLSYLVGWFGVLGWQVGVAYTSYIAATVIQSLAALNYPHSYIPQTWHATLIQILLLLISVGFNTFLAQKLHLVEGCILVLHVCGFFGILIPLWILSPTATSEEVWTTFSNPGWESTGLAVLIGTVASVAPLLGADAAAHMAEELQHASYTLPRVLTLSSAINGCLMFVMAITFCYCLGDPSVLSAPYPFILVFYNSTKSLAATNAMTAIVIILVFFTTVTMTAGSSRQLFAFARDGALPFSRWISAVRPGFDVPVNAIIVIFIVSVIIGLINIGSKVAFSIITSLGTGTLSGSYIVTISIVYWRKLTGRPLLPSRFDMGMVGGLVVNTLALIWLWIVFIFCFFPLFPLATGWTAADMNWAVVVWGGVVVFAIIYFAVWARKVYDGPVEYVRKLD